MNFSAIPYKTWYGKMLRFPLRFIPSNTIIPILQGKLRGKRWIVGSGTNGYWLGSYDYEKQIVFERTITEGSTVFDIGAHAGFYTLLFSVLVGSRGKVFAFEPMPRNLFYLRKHLQLNHITNVTVIEAAVKDSTGTVFFDKGYDSFMYHVSAEGRIKVRSIGLDDLVLQGEIPKPDYIKINAEGAEMLILLGAKSILTNAYPVLFLSLHHGCGLRQKCCEFLKSLGYYLQPVIGNNIEEATEILAYRRG